MKQILVDFGSDYLYLSLVGHPEVLAEPALVAVDSTTRVVKAVGAAAKKASGCTLVRPIVEGCLVQEAYAVALFRHAAQKLGTSFTRSKVICGTSVGLNSRDKAAIESLFNQLGVKGTVFVESAIADYCVVQEEFGVSDALIVNIGADCSEVTYMQNGRILGGGSVYIAGNRLDSTIASYLEDKYQLQLTEEQLRNVKEQCVSLYANDVSSQTITGTTPDGEKTVSLGARELYDAVSYLISRVLEVAKGLLREGPSADTEVYLTGGTAQLQGLDSFVSQELGRPVHVLEHAERSVLDGLRLYVNKKKEENATE